MDSYDTRIILVSNRLPVSLKKRQGRIVYQDSIGGVSIGLEAVRRTFNTVWLGAVNIPSEILTMVEKMQIREYLLQTYSCVPVFLTKRQIDGHYYGFSNCILWPRFHGFEPREKPRKWWWRTYCSVNAKFVKEIKRILLPDDRIWINDYHFALMPSMLKEELDIRDIRFFLHIAFPRPAEFWQVPWSEQILHGLTGALVIGTYKSKYARRLKQCFNQVLGMKQNCDTKDKIPPQVNVFRIGIDPQRIKSLLRSGRTQTLIGKLKNKFGDTRIILSADRLDYTKGIPQKLEAYNLFLEKYPAYRKKVRLLLIVSPCRMDLAEYADLISRIQRQADEINRHHSFQGWCPIEKISKNVPYVDLMAYYFVSDAIMVTPLEDAMNLMAKEYLYVDSYNGCKGGLILSKHAGAAYELRESFLVDPNRIEEVADALGEYLNSADDQIKKRNTTMLQRLRKQTVIKWAEDFINTYPAEHGG